MAELPEAVRRRIAEIFGDDAPTPRDERADDGSSTERADPDDRDRALREDRPPHHGG